MQTRMFQIQPQQQQEATQRIHWKPTDPQWQVLTSEAKYRVFLGGIGSGKTALGCMCAARQAISQPGSVGVVVAPTYPMMRNVIWRELFRWLPEQSVLSFDQHRHELKTTNGSIILFQSADNPRQIDRLRGLSIAWFWADEVTLMPKLVWDVLIGRLRQPNMRYFGLLTGTPKMNWVYDVFASASSVQTHQPDLFVLSGIPTYSNPNLPKEYVESLRQQYTGQFFDQEVLGQFVQFEGLVYHLSAGAVLDLQPRRYPHVVYGVDFGFTNPSAVVVLAEVGTGLWAVVDEFYQRRVTDDELSAVLTQKQEIFGIGKLVCDPSAPASIEKLRRDGLNAEKASTDVLGGIRQVRTMMDSGKLRFASHCQNVLNELRMYSWSDKKTKEQPVKLSDHAMDALRYAVVSLQTCGSQKRFVTAADIRSW